MPEKQNKHTRSAGFSSQEEGGLSVGKPWFFGIGINSYRHFPQLRNARKDVEDVLQLLQERYESYESITLFDELATRAAIIDQLYLLQSRLNEEDKLIIYYSGHGFLDKWGRGYWLPADAAPRKASSFIRSSAVLECLEDISARHVLLISDSCFSGALLARDVGYAQAALDEMERERSRWVISSGREREEVADGRPGENSPFTGSVLKVLRGNREARLNANLLFDKVTKLTRFNYKQMPQSAPLFGAGHEGGQYVFHLRDAAGNIEEQPPPHTLPLRGRQPQPQPPRTLPLQGRQPQPTSFTDPRDGQVYRTIEINGITWLAQNLNFDAGKGCWFYDNDPRNGEQYGRLYTWEAARKACPPGWRLPGEEEWSALAMHFGGYYDKENWKSTGDPGKAYEALIYGGESGFGALLGGRRRESGSFTGLRDEGYYWSGREMEGSPDRAWHYCFDSDRDRLYCDIEDKLLAFSCRCVKM